MWSCCCCCPDKQTKQGPAGNTVLHLSVLGDHAECAEMLMLAGCDTSLTNNDGETAFDMLETKYADDIKAAKDASDRAAEAVEENTDDDNLSEDEGSREARRRRRATSRELRHKRAAQSVPHPKCLALLKDPQVCVVLCLCREFAVVRWDNVLNFCFLGRWHTFSCASGTAVHWATDCISNRTSSEHSTSSPRLFSCVSPMSRKPGINNNRTKNLYEFHRRTPQRSDTTVPEQPCICTLLLSTFAVQPCICNCLTTDECPLFRLPACLPACLPELTD